MGNGTLKEETIGMARIAGPGHGDNVLFMHRWFDETGQPVLAPNPVLYLSAEQFRGIGEPDEITVTVVAGAIS